jgi:hypothetical protein
MPSETYYIDWSKGGISMASNQAFDFPNHNEVKFILKIDKYYKDYLKNQIQIFSLKDTLNKKIEFNDNFQRLAFDIYKDNGFIMCDGKIYDKNFNQITLEQNKIYTIYTKNHTGAIYNKCFIDNGGILENERDWIENLVQKEGFHYIRTNAIKPWNYFVENLSGNNWIEFDLKNLTNISLMSPETDKEKNLMKEGLKKNPFIFTKDDVAKNMCVPTMMALVAMFQMEGKLDIEKIATKFDTEKILLEFHKSHPEKINENTSIFDIKALSNDTKLVKNNIKISNLNDKAKPAPIMEEGFKSKDREVKESSKLSKWQKFKNALSCNNAVDVIH